MDLSSEFIRMCEKATEIQKLRDAKRIGDFFFSQLDIERCCFVNYPYPEQPTYTIAECYAPEVITWLPRQDQLQKMVPYGPPSQVHMIEDFMDSNYKSELCSDGIIEWESPEMIFDTWEQLWLAFVMFELYHKKWYIGEWSNL